MIRRPLVCGVLVFVIGQLIGMKSAAILGLVAAGAVAVWMIYQHYEADTEPKTGPFFYCFIGLCMLLGILNGTRLTLNDELLTYVEQQNKTEKLYMEIHGTVARITDKADYTTVELITDSITDDTVSVTGRYRVRLNLYTDCDDLLIGDILCCTGKLRCPEATRNIGEFDQEIYYGARGIVLLGTASEYQIVGHKGGTLRQCIFRMQTKSAQAFDAALSPEQAGIMKTMVLGMVGDPDSEWKELYRRNGISHILAISALHITILGTTLYRMLRKIGLPYVASGIPVILLLLAYGWMTGFSGSTIRAIIMFGLLLFGDMIGRTYDMITATAVACLYMLVEAPMRILDTAFLLSFTAVLTLGIVVPAWKELLHIQKKWQEVLLSGIIIQVMTAPVIIHSYYDFPIYAWLINLIVIPLMTPLLLCGILGVLVSGIHMSCGCILLIPCGYILNIYTYLCRCTEKLPYAILTIGDFPVYKVFLYYSLLLLVYLSLRHKQYPMLCVGFSVYIAVMWITSPTGLSISMLDVGQGDSILMRLPGDTIVLMDGGSSSRSSIGKYVIAPAVKYYGSSCIDYVFVSHMDADHVNGIMELIQLGGQKSVDIGNLILPDIAGADESFAPILEAASEAGIPVYLMSENEEICMDGVSFRCLYAGDLHRFPQDKNNNSMVISVSYGEFDMLFAGDLEQEGEELLMQDQTMQHYEVYKVSHHGASNASSAALLKAISPEQAVISCGRGNSYGHPHEETLDKLVSMGCTIYRTDQNGCITITVSGKEVRVMPYCKSG